MSSQKVSVPNLPCLDEYSLFLAKMVANTSYLPHPDTVQKLNSPVFPTARNSQMRVTSIEKDGVPIGMYDDNTTPRWALLWAHGFSGVSKVPSKGWTFAHVWQTQGDLGAYTHLANLAMVPECFSSLTDKDGPLTHFLRWHSWETYQWKPESKEEPRKPAGYSEITWKYFDPIPDPKAFICDRLAKANCKRSHILKPLVLSRNP